MKRLKSLLTLLLLLFSLSLSNSTLAASPVKGEKTLGIGGGYATFNHSGYANVYFQYTFVPHVRLSADVGCIFRNEDKSGLAIDVDMHFPFRIVRGLQVYPLVGLAFNSWNYHYDGRDSRFGGDFGAGFDFYMTDNLKLSLQGKYSWMKDTSGAFVGLGIGYVF